MTVKESYAELGLVDGDNLALVKQAYRKRAFELHPDLHPGAQNTARRFQRLNEAYVFLIEHLKTVESSASKTRTEGSAERKAREEAHRAYTKAKEKEGKTKKNSFKEEVLRDILNDPFARRVFEDIYRHAQKEEKIKTPPSSEESFFQQHEESIEKEFIKNSTIHDNYAVEDLPQKPHSSGVVGKIKNWFKQQIDDKQELRLPGASLVPGAVVRLDIQHGFSGTTQTLELTLPPGFVPGKTLRLKGMGKRLGRLSGDLYVKIVAV